MNANFDVMMTRISPTLKRITHRLNGNFTFFSDEDLFQEALIHLWSSFRDGRLCDKTDSYILQGCYFHLKNYLRTMLDKVRADSLNRSIDDGDNQLQDILPDADNETINNIDGALINDALRSMGLTEREWTILTLNMEGLTVREIGEKLGISHVMVLKLKEKIRQKCAPLKQETGYQNR